MPIQLNVISRTVPPQLRPSHPVLQQCYFCGSTLNLTTEHVTPKIMFKPHTTDTRLTLKSCRQCNATKSREDEYVLRYLQATSFIPEARECWLEGVRGFRRANSSSPIFTGNTSPGGGLRQDMISRLQQMTFTTDSGLVVDRGNVMGIDNRRFERYIVDLAKGLWVRNSAQQIPWQDYEVNMDVRQLIQSQASRISSQGPPYTMALHSSPEGAINGQYLYSQEPFKSIWANGRYGQYWTKIFTYAGGVTDNNEESVWLMLFYSSTIACVSFTKRTVNP